MPQKPLETAEVRSGDCKAKSALLVCLLASIGVKSEVILVNYDEDFFLDNFLPSPFAFNHAIVKVFYKDQEYIVDPVWSSYYGFLEYRTEPYFLHYLPVVSNTTLVVKKTKRKIYNEYNFEENAEINLLKGKVEIKIESTYKREDASLMRNFFTRLDEKEVLKQRDKIILERIEEIKTGEKITSIENSEFSVISDDKDHEVIKFLYKASIINPYRFSKVTKDRIFKYYYRNTFDLSRIYNYNHLDYELNSFTSFPLRYTIKIHTNQVFRTDIAASTKNTKIDNDYFIFKNIKKIRLKNILVEGEYLPKIFDVIKKEDVEKIKKDYSVVIMNTGAGVIDLNFWLTLIVAIFIAAIFLAIIIT